MESLSKHMPAIAKRLGGGCVLMLDFDGVLAPLVPAPKDARISAATKALVLRATKCMPVIIISGRSLGDLKRRVGLTGIIYAGSHGMEWEAGGRVQSAPASMEAQDALTSASRALHALAKYYVGVTVEKKQGSIALHYRALSLRDARALRREAVAAVRACVRLGHLRVLDNKRTFEVLLDIDWTKGHCAAMLFGELQRKAKKRLVPIYIGDSVTDEDAFSICKTGVTIRVGYSARSAARYFVRTRPSIDRFLQALCEV